MDVIINGVFELNFKNGVLNVISKRNLSLSKEAVKKLSEIKTIKIDFID